MRKNDEQDDFANDKEIMRLRKKKAEHKKMINDSLKVVKSALNAKASTRKNIKDFFLYKSIPRPSVTGAFTGEWNGRLIYISTIQYYTSVHLYRMTSAGTDDYLLGVIQLKESYPHIIIQPEILALKIEDFFNKMDVDFKHAKWFSFLFYVITKDKAALDFKFQSKELNKIAKFLDAEIEIIGYNCYFRANRNAISIKEAERFVKLAKILAELL